MKTRFQGIQDHFDREATVYDRLAYKVIPQYERMMDALVGALPFRQSDSLRIVDLGCGTANLTRKLVAAYPRARVICVDMAENMISMAQAKLKGARNVSFWRGDVRDFDFAETCDVVTASLVLHHVEGRHKPPLYRAIHNALSRRGVFFCLDMFLSPDRHLQKVCMADWRAFMRSNGLSPKRVDDMVARHHKEDRPVALTDEVAIMQEAGFRRVDVLMKQYNFAVYGGFR